MSDYSNSSWDSLSSSSPEEDDSEQSWVTEEEEEEEVGEGEVDGDADQRLVKYSVCMSVRI